MNKLGIHTCSYIKRFSEDPSTAFSRLRACGIDVVEVPVLDDYTPQRAERLSALLQANALEATCCTALPSGADLTAATERDKENAVLYLKHCVDFCVNLGAPTLSGILYTPWGNVDCGRSKPEKWAATLLPMREVCNYAKQKGVSLCVEVLNRFEGNFINTLEEGRAYLSLVDCSNLKLLADYFHANIEERHPVESIIQNAAVIGNVHITEATRGFPQRDNSDWMQLIAGLQNGGYQGNFVFECCVSTESEVGNAFSQWQDLLGNKNVFDEIEQSVCFIKETLNHNRRGE